MTASLVRVRRLLPAEIDRVFAAWSSADALARWFVCDPEWTATATSEFRVGGRYRIEMRSGGRVVGGASGEYRAIERPRRIVFTWTSEGGMLVADSLVTVELTAIGSKTELLLTHDLAPETPAGRAHTAGWEACLGSLERLLSVGK